MKPTSDFGRKKTSGQTAKNPLRGTKARSSGRSRRSAVQAPSPLRIDSKDRERRVRGRSKSGAAFPAAPPKSVLPKGYRSVLGTIKDRVRQERIRVALSANSALILLYWDIGRLVLQRQGHAGWGARIVDRLSHDLRTTFPDMKGFSPRNLKYMRAFAAAWPQRSIVQEQLAQITWYHNIALLEKLSGAEERLWYAREAAKNGWTHALLKLHIDAGVHQRTGKAQTNFAEALPSGDAERVAQVFKDPYVFDFMGAADLRYEQQLEQSLVDHIQGFLLELGTGFAFVGRQVHLESADRDFYIDLLFYHVKLHCYVVVELKAVPFDPSFVGKMNVYLSAVDDLLRSPEDKATIGLLLCRSKDSLIVEYALRGLKRPIGVADWETQLVSQLPETLKGSLPSVEEIEAELGDLQPSLAIAK